MTEYLHSNNEFEVLIEKIKNIPYGRNSNRSDFSLVIKEQKGTCSSKHAFLKDYADKNQITNVKLFIGIFKMTELNTTKIYPLSFYDKIKNDILEEIEIEPDQVVEFKIQFHQTFLKNWISKSHQSKTFEEIWNIREKCIQKLSL